jgi:lysophospholipase L1-like esterase
MRRLRKPGYALVVLAGCVLATNLLAAVGERLAYGAWWADGRPAGLYREGDQKPGANGRFRVRLQPGARLDGWLAEITVNAMGFRGAEIEASKPDNALRIWCLGGSTTFDIYAPEDASAWPARVGALVQAARPDRRVEVVNAGIPGETLSGNTEDLRDIGPRVRPDYVVIYAGPNDLRDVLDPAPRPPVAGQPAAGKPPPARPLSVPWRERLDFALLRVADRWGQAQGFGRTDFPDRRLDDAQITELRRRVLAAVDAATALGARAVLATHAFRAAEDATGETARRQAGETAALLRMPPEASIAAFRTYNQLITTLARERGLPLADVRAAVPPDPELWGDATHFAAPGSAAAAEVVARALLEPR